MNASPVLAILVGSIFTNNILFASFLGMCSFLVCSNRIDTAIGLGGPSAKLPLTAMHGGYNGCRRYVHILYSI